MRCKWGSVVLSVWCFVCKLHPQCSVQLNRRVLSDLAITEPRTFQALVALARARQQEGLRAALGDGKEPPGVFSRITQLQWRTALTANHSFSKDSTSESVKPSVTPGEGAVWRNIKSLLTWYITTPALKPSETEIWVLKETCLNCVVCKYTNKTNTGTITWCCTC